MMFRIRQLVPSGCDWQVAPIAPRPSVWEVTCSHAEFPARSELETNMKRPKYSAYLRARIVFPCSPTDTRLALLFKPLFNLMFANQQVLGWFVVVAQRR